MDLPRAELARLCRQICLQCEMAIPRTKTSEEDFIRVLAQVQEQFGIDSVNEETLWEIVAAEENRVADAVVLAEILLPKLTAVLRTRGTPQPSVAVPSALPATPSNSDAPTMARSGPLGVADLIQGMLDQDRKDPRPRSPSRS